jgi:hypothetical protein
MAGRRGGGPTPRRTGLVPSPLGRGGCSAVSHGLALGTRSAVALARENQPNPLVRLAGQDDRVAAAVRTARLRARQGPERSAAER